MNPQAIFEYTAKLTDCQHAEEGGEFVHCLIEMNVVDKDGRSRHGVELEQEAGDLILFAVGLGPNRRIADSKIWKVDEHRLREMGAAKVVDRIGKCQIYFYS
jgi:hypothetical protein